jgi:hypothetical protein
MERDEALEAISDKIRHGEPVGIWEAVAAIDYQKARQRHAAENTPWRRFVRLFRRKSALTAPQEPQA